MKTRYIRSSFSVTGDENGMMGDPNSEGKTPSAGSGLLAQENGKVIFILKESRGTRDVEVAISVSLTSS